MACFLMAFLCVASLLAAKYVSDLTISSCFQKLEDSTVQYAETIRDDVESDRKLLQITADYIANGKSMDAKRIAQLLTLSKAGAMLDSMGLILPDGRVFENDDALREELAAIPYEEEAARGAHLSGRVAGIGDPNRFYLYHFVPIVKNGQTKGLLCGVIDLEKMRKRYSRELEEGTSLHLLEGRSSAFLIDTVHDGLTDGKLLTDRTIKTGYSLESVLSDIEGGRPGRCSFLSRTAGEYYYCVYEPVGINDWMIIQGQPESVALHDAKDIRAILKRFAAVELAAFLFYLVFVFFAVRRAFDEREKELDRVQYILKIEKILFNAARNPDMIEDALHEIAVRHEAEHAFFIIYGKEGIEKMYTWSEKEGKASEGFAKEGYTKNDFPVLCSRFLEEGSILSYDMKELAGDAAEEYRQLQRMGIESLIAVPVKEPNDVHVGSLGVANMKKRGKTVELLEWVMLSFSMAVQNIASFQAIEEMGNRDRLTGLKNRNSYQKTLEIYEQEQEPGLSCVYVDADGLHDINNQYGHEAGDLLLQTAAGVLGETFGEEDVYRIGGDEFVAFCHGFSGIEVEQKVKQAEKKIEEKGYHISVGIERREAKPFIYEMIKQAEVNMFEAKRSYHETKGEEVKIRGMNIQLEKTLMKKRDLDVFCAVLSSKYLGVYIVDLRTDTFRYIFIPPYFRAAADQSCGKFSVAITIYAASFVGEDYREEFLQLLDYSSTEERLNRGEDLELFYARPDGEAVHLRIHLSPNYDESCRECIWTFETAGEPKKESAPNG